jgi:membrane protein required for colicin V production
MNGLDIALGVILGFFFLRGIFRGFVKEVAGVFGLVAGFYLAIQYYPVLGDSLKPFLQNPSYRHAVGFQIIFLAAFFLVGLLGLLMDKLIKLTISPVGNGLIGAVIGTGKAVVLCSVLLMATTAFIRTDSPFFRDSQLWPYFQITNEYIRPYIPEDLKKAFENKGELLPDNLRPALPDLSGGPKKPPAWKPPNPEEGTAMPGSPPPRTQDPTATPPTPEAEGAPKPAWPGDGNQ